MKKVQFYIFTFILGLLLGYQSASHAQDAMSSQFGMIWGFSVPDLDSTNPLQVYGVKGSAFLSPVFSIGGYYIVSGSKEGTGGIDFDFSQHGLDASYHMPTNTGDTYVSVRYGVSKVRTTQSSVDLIFSPYHYGLAVGHDFHVNSWWSIGFEGNNIRVQQAASTVGGTRYTEDAFSVLTFLVTSTIRL